MASVEQILLYVPNLIGYARLLLIFLAWVFWDAHPPLFVILYVASAILDFFDGYFARKLNQCTSFGAWFGFWICALEWTAFVCNHTLGSNWRQEIGDGASGSGRLSDKPSEIVDLGNTGSRSTGLIETTVQRIMAKGFHTPTGGLAIAGLHVLPIWLYGLQMNVKFPIHFCEMSLDIRELSWRLEEYMIITGMAFSPDGTHLVAANSDGMMAVFESEADITDLSVHEDAVAVALGSEGGLIYDLENGKLVSRLQASRTNSTGGFCAPIWCVKFSESRTVGCGPGLPPVVWDLREGSDQSAKVSLRCVIPSPPSTPTKKPAKTPGDSDSKKSASSEVLAAVNSDFCALDAAENYVVSGGSSGPIVWDVRKPSAPVANMDPSEPLIMEGSRVTTLRFLSTSASSFLLGLETGRTVGQLDRDCRLLSQIKTTSPGVHEAVILKENGLVAISGNSNMIDLSHHLEYRDCSLRFALN
ncbi:unnamed protein product [Cyprideis torosa]|uniref:Uncharacterized protein n=1 Tax=Cyprideis torosa TaxID=163714 RepID=A0A7R8WJB5_9CRUS|nr:unnamed protein product [Cyprideis torosa]CAG0901765.1 unnamed protein product [Cyprideis torosa]